jgi:hypothetical protein
MPRRTARGNRIGLALVGLGLLVAGAAALARGTGLWPRVFGDRHAAVTDRYVRDFADDHLWFWIALAAAAVVVALLALRWLAVQARTDALRSIRLEPDPREGTTTLPARALTGALDDDLAGSVYLRRATATLTGSPARPRLSLTVTLEPDADPAAAKHRIDQALDRARQAMEVADLPTVVHIRTGR